MRKDLKNLPTSAAGSEEGGREGGGEVTLAAPVGMWLAHLQSGAGTNALLCPHAILREEVSKPLLSSCACEYAVIHVLCPLHLCGLWLPGNTDSLFQTVAPMLLARASNSSMIKRNTTCGKRVRGVTFTHSRLPTCHTAGHRPVCWSPCPRWTS